MELVEWAGLLALLGRVKGWLLSVASLGRDLECFSCGDVDLELDFDRTGLDWTLFFSPFCWTLLEMARASGMTWSLLLSTIFVFGLDTFVVLCMHASFERERVGVCDTY